MDNKYIQMRVKEKGEWNDLYPRTKAILVEEDIEHRFVTNDEKAIVQKLLETGGGATITTSETAPENAGDGSVWYEIMS